MKYQKRFTPEAKAAHITDLPFHSEGAQYRGFVSGTPEVYDMLHDAWIPFSWGDFIMKGDRGEFYPVRRTVFERTYKPCQEQEHRHHIWDTGNCVTMSFACEGTGCRYCAAMRETVDKSVAVAAGG